MDRDEVWRTIDQQRAELADLMETFTESGVGDTLALRGLAGPRGGRAPDAGPHHLPGRGWAQPSGPGAASTG